MDRRPVNAVRIMLHGWEIGPEVALVYLTDGTVMAHLTGRQGQRIAEIVHKREAGKP